MSETAPLREAIKQLRKSIENTVSHFEAIDTNNIPELLKSYKTLYELEGELSTLSDILTTLKNKMSYETIPDTFERFGIDSIKTAQRNFIVSARLNASLPVQTRDEGIKWLQSNNLGELVIPSVNSKTLSSAIKSYIEENGKEPPKEIFSIHRQRYTTIRK